MKELKYRSALLLDFIKKSIEQMTELKRQNYHSQEEIKNRNKTITNIENALSDLEIPFKTDWQPSDDYEEDEEDY